MGLQSITDFVEFRVNFVQIFHIDIIVVSCTIQCIDYNGVIEIFQVEMSLLSRDLLEFGVNFVQMFYVNIILNSCGIRGNDYNGSH